MKAIIVSFSSRTDGNCTKIGKLIKENTKDSILFSFSDFSVKACGECNYDSFKKREECPHVGDMECDILDSIVHSEITYFVLPNYCDYPCANFFAFNERSQCYFKGKPDLLNAYLRVPKRSIVVSNTNEENFIKALFSLEDASEILSWKGNFRSVTSRSYMRGYRDIYSEVSRFHKLMIRFCDKLVKMVIIKIRFKQSL